MIDGFEKQTHELTDYEMNVLLPRLVNGFVGKTGTSKSVTSVHICKVFKGNGYKLDPPRLRKLIQHIRINQLVPCLVSSSKGYYIAESYSEMKKYINSFDQRINAMTVSRDALEYQMKQRFK